MSTISRKNLIAIKKGLFEIPRTFRDDMRVDAAIFADDALLEEIMRDRSLTQLVNVATLPGICYKALAMPDAHEGYGFPIGGVAGTDIHAGGVISPGGIGYDINCGVRLLGTSLMNDELAHYQEQLADTLYAAVPSGVGRGGAMTLQDGELTKILHRGAPALIARGIGTEDDILHCEEGGALADADAAMISDKARNRGRDQLGTLGSGNHFLEVQHVDTIYDKRIATAFGLQQNQVTTMIHCGSRGLGHQTCTEYVRQMIPKLPEWGISLPDKELACAPFFSPEGTAYYKAMCASANFAWANRHTIGHRVRESFKKIVGENVSVKTIYDISHNIGKKEIHTVDGKDRELLVHRKGATRAFPAGSPYAGDLFRHTGHPILVPGTMGTSSYVLVANPESLSISLASACHGAGRRMSRTEAKRTTRGSTLKEHLEAAGILIRCDSDAGLAEEAPSAYKDVDRVVGVLVTAGIARLVARLAPRIVIKGG